MNNIRRLILYALILPLTLMPALFSAAASAPADIRVGIVASEDFDAELGRWRECFSYCAAASGGRLNFRISPGTYGDVLHWMNEDLIDLAVATSAVFAESQAGHGNSDSSETGFEYLATLDMRPARGPWAVESRRREGSHYTYRAVCVVSKDAPWKTFDELAADPARKDIRFVFADPLSVSGRIMPEFILRKAGITPGREAVRYAFSHTGVLRSLAGKKPGLNLVGFVWDDAISGAPELSAKLRKLPFPDLEKIELPHDVIAVRRALPEKELLSKTLLNYRDPNGRLLMERLESGAASYAQVRQWSSAIGLSPRAPELQNVSLDEIGQILQHYSKSQQSPPRLALVLSGGGAKCSYQAGAIAAIEEKLERTKQIFKDTNFGIDMVVGTSGGAVNALPVAMGITRTAAGRDELKRVWPKLDQRVILRPSTPVRAMSGLWLTLLEAGILLILVRYLAASPESHAPAYFKTLIALSAVQWALIALPVTPWRVLGDNHIIHHIWLWFDIAMRASTLPLFIFALSGYLLQRRLRRNGRSLHFKSVPIVLISITMLVLLPVILLVTVFFFSETLSGSEGLELVLADSFQPLVEHALSRSGKPPLLLTANASPAERFTEMSRRIFSDRLLTRDLIVTANALKQSHNNLPSDLYFYSWRSGNNSIFGDRGVCLDDHPDRLVDIIMGSSSVFPVFPPRRLIDFPAAGEFLDLVDGGFAHNSPIEAAVLRGATHIILIESTPEEFGEHKNMAANIAAAFEHLHKQTQLIDLRSKRYVVIFTLVPKPPHICMLDFTDTLISKSIEQGYRDARGESTAFDSHNSVMPSFRKELGEPIFTEIKASR
jgi:predicted acylesterase/phospholipase RssA/ABC-type phosphate/phosphonate transport system substrate-binding protein